MMDSKGAPPMGWMARVVVRYEELIIVVLMSFLMVVVAISTLELGWLLLQDAITMGHRMLIDVEEMLELFGFFLLVLVGIELLVTLKSYLFDRVIHVEVVLEVSLIAVAQKVIITDKSAGATTLLGLAGLVVALALAFWIVKIARRPTPPPGSPK